MSKSKLIFITGATKGIGRATAFTFAKAGWDLILLARNFKELEKLKNELIVFNVKVNICNCDLSDDEIIESSISKLLKDFGCPSVVLNNAGFAYNGELMSMPLEQWQKIIQVNLTSIFQICSETCPDFCQVIIRESREHVHI